MLLSSLCPPALLYVGFSIVQIIIDTLKGGYNTALFKFIIMIVFTILLNTLCRQGLGIISWFIVFIPFLLMTFLTTLLLFVFDLSPESGKRSDREIINSKPIERKEKESDQDSQPTSHNSNKSA